MFGTGHNISDAVLVNARNGADDNFRKNRGCRRKLIISEHDSLRIEGEQAAASAGLISKSQKIPLCGVTRVEQVLCRSVNR